jgi:hypothetical protein
VRSDSRDGSGSGCCRAAASPSFAPGTFARLLVAVYGTRGRTERRSPDGTYRSRAICCSARGRWGTSSCTRGRRACRRMKAAPQGTPSCTWESSTGG